MTEQKVSTRYAHALIGVASEAGILDKTMEDLKYVERVIKSSRELGVLLRSPVVSHVHKKKIIKEIFDGNVNELVVNFLLLLADKNRESLVISIVAQFLIQFNRIKNRLPVDITSAFELPDDLKAKIIGKIEAQSKKTVLPTYHLNKLILGGIQVKIDDWLFDASIKTQLEALRLKMIED